MSKKPEASVQLFEVIDELNARAPQFLTYHSIASFLHCPITFSIKICKG